MPLKRLNSQNQPQGPSQTPNKTKTSKPNPTTIITHNHLPTIPLFTYRRIPKNHKLYLHLCNLHFRHIFSLLLYCFLHVDNKGMPENLWSSADSNHCFCLCLVFGVRCMASVDPFDFYENSICFINGYWVLEIWKKKCLSIFESWVLVPQNAKNYLFHIFGHVHRLLNATVVHFSPKIKIL